MRKIIISLVMLLGLVASLSAELIRYGNNGEYIKIINQLDEQTWEVIMPVNNEVFVYLCKDNYQLNQAKKLWYYEELGYINGTQDWWYDFEIVLDEYKDGKHYVYLEMPISSYK